MSGPARESTSSPDRPTAQEVVQRGLSAAPGIVIGPAFVVSAESVRVSKTHVDDVDAEVARFQRALDATRQDLDQIKFSMAKQMGEDHAKIFDAHLMILDDIMVVEDTEKQIREERRNAAWAFNAVISGFLQSFGEIEDEYLKERFADVVDVEKRVIQKLQGKKSRRVTNPTKPSIVVAHALTPSETAQLDRKVVLGYATDTGGRTSHTAILARSQGLAAVVGLDGVCGTVQTGDNLILDGNTGTVVVNPTAKTLEKYEEEIRRFHELEQQLLTLTGYPAETLDNKKIELMANIDLADEIDYAIEYGAEGVGLFRTEYFFIAQEQLPSEDEQYNVYRHVIEKMRGKPVTIRALDIGGDKIAGYIQGSEELNPFMGWRGIRFLLTRKDIFKTQLRAIYRASAHGPVKIMLPLIVQLDEVQAAKQICEEVYDELKRARYRLQDRVEIGIMIETPAAVALADVLAKHVDFFSVGTNDLIQYTMAVDRGNAKIAHLYHHLHPSIIRLLKMTMDAARKAKIPVSICGEMGVDPLSAVLLIGLQFNGFSCSPNMIPEVKKLIRSVTMDECKSLLKRALKATSAQEIESEARALLKERCPELQIFSAEEAR